MGCRWLLMSSILLVLLFMVLASSFQSSCLAIREIRKARQTVEAISIVSILLPLLSATLQFFLLSYCERVSVFKVPLRKELHIYLLQDYRSRFFNKILSLFRCTPNIINNRLHNSTSLFVKIAKALLLLPVLPDGYDHRLYDQDKSFYANRIP